MKALSFFVTICAIPALASAQTQVDLRTQSKNLDFSQASSARPIPTGTVLPANCSTGALYFKTDVAVGANLYGCVAPNTWAAESSASGGAGSGSGIALPFDLSQSSSILTVGGSCTATVPCKARVGSVVYSFVSPATATISSGTGTVFVYIDSGGTLTVGASSSTAPAFTCSGCSAVSGITGFPTDSLPLATWSATSGAWTSGADLRAVLSTGPALRAGQNVALAASGGSVTISAAGSNGLMLVNPNARPSEFSSSSPAQKVPNMGEEASSRLGTGPKLPVCDAWSRGTMFLLTSEKGGKDSLRICAKGASEKFFWRSVHS